MAKHPLTKKASREIQIEAQKIARSRQYPGQTKEQARLIAKGIQQGIEQYRRQQSAKERDYDKELKKLRRQDGQSDPGGEVRIEERVIYRQHWLPWVLLALTWLGFGYWALVGF